MGVPREIVIRDRMGLVDTTAVSTKRKELRDKMGLADTTAVSTKRKELRIGFYDLHASLVLQTGVMTVNCWWGLHC